MKRFFQLIINKLFKPHNIVIFTVSLSALSWFSPVEGFERGFSSPEPVTVTNVLFMAAWYTVVIASAYFFFLLGRQVKPFKFFDEVAPIDSRNIYRAYSYLGLIGFVAAIYKIFATYGISALYVTLFVDFQGNAVQDALYDDYSIGIVSLRYVLIITFGLALYRLQVKKEYSLLNFINVAAFLIYTLVLGRRIQILTSFFVYIALANRGYDMLKRVKAKVIYISASLVVLLIVISSTVRNYNTYADRGTTNPFSATLANVVEYLGSPFQAGLEIGNNLPKATNDVYYLSFTKIDESLNTNSAITNIIYDYGWMCFLYVVIVFGFYAFLAGVLFKNKNNCLFIGYPVILYGFAEIWRLNQFVTGLFITLLFVAVGVPIAIACYKKFLAYLAQG